VTDALPSWLEPLPDAERMRATDRWAIETQAIPSLDLMERAGLGLARIAEALAPEGRVLVVCGKGNNGGDGLVTARLLRDSGREVDVRLLGAEPGDLRGDVAANLQRLPGAGPTPFGDEALDGAGLIVDAVLGTGFAGEVREPLAGALRRLAAGGAPVLAADVPSGVDASTGEVAGVAVRAQVTATFHAAKPGLWVNPGKAHAGEVRVVDIGIPRGHTKGGVPPAQVGLIREGVLDELPTRAPGWTKFDSGHVLVVGGSRGLTGAPTMSCQAAARAGAGYVTACVPSSTQIVFQLRLLEVMSHGLPDRDGELVPDGVIEVMELARRGGAIALGPGLGRGEGAGAFAREVARAARTPLVIDADGLNAHVGHLEALTMRAAPTVLTPHTGELARLLDTTAEAVDAQRLAHARHAAARSGAIVVLKGEDTLIVRPDGFVAVSPGASPALATAGTGDVLTGVLAAILSRGTAPFTAAAAAVRLHARAGREAVRRQGSVDGVIASDVIDALPAARGRE
jgi:NAD(P)H-hydrate epimerase